MPYRNAAILVVTAVAFAAPAAHAAAPASLRAGAAATPCAAKVTIAGKGVCLIVGKSCKPKYKTKYASKGFVCSRSARGQYKLKKSKQVF